MLNDLAFDLAKCSICKKYFDVKNHQCYIQPVKERCALEDKTSNESRYKQLLFFTFEFCQEDKTRILNLCFE